MTIANTNHKPSKGSTKKRMILSVALLLILSTLLQCLILGQISRIKMENKLQEAYIRGQNIAGTIQLTFDNATEASQAVKYFYLDNEKYTEAQFDAMAAEVMADHPVIASMYIAPEGVIRAAYPEAVKASTIGFEMLKDPDQGPRAQLAIDTGKITLAGPHNLVEGGSGVILRNPVFENGSFKGFTILVLDWDKMVDQILTNIGSSMDQYKFAVRKQTADETAVTDGDGYIFRNSDASISHDVDIEFEVPNDVWHLTIEPIEGWRVLPEMWPSIFVSVFISCSVIALVVFAMFYNNRLKQLQIEQAENETKSLYLSQLSAALDKAERADAAKTAFLSRMSHDIRTPLNGIIGLVQINEKHADNRTLVDENRQKILVAANHLLELINDVLDIAKMDDDNVRLVEEPLDLKALTEDVLTIIENRAIEAGITLKHNDFAQEFSHPYVYGSPLHLRQIIINLLSNAIKYNKPGGSISCEVKRKKLGKDSVTYQLTVSDTGIGMSEEFLSRIFEPFSQEHADERSVHYGTGLGMTIVKSLVEKMNGHIHVASRLGEGTTFTVVIPFRLADEADLPQQEEAVDFDFTGMRILLVEDNELNVEIAEAILTDVGAVITTASNGAEALDIFTSRPTGSFDVILSDIMMPEMNGYELTKAIRQLADRPDGQTIPIIAMTANAFEEDRRKALDAGMDGHVTKPVDVSVLLKTLARIAGKH
ncbi:MAG: ATP-binding protein [Lachnospiraceae bacterium]|nr:ATP-binding protein [Lachnospiraceae bacterium]